MSKLYLIHLEHEIEPKPENEQIKMADNSKILEVCMKATGNRNKQKISRSLLILPKLISMNLQSLPITQMKKYNQFVCKT